MDSDDKNGKRQIDNKLTMGKMKFKYSWGQIDIDNYHNYVNKETARQYFEKKYRPDIINLLEFNGDDIEVPVDLSEDDIKLDLTNNTLVSEKVKTIINELERYAALSMHLEKLVRKISTIRFENRDEIIDIGQAARDLIDNFYFGEYLSCLAAKDTASSAILHTLNQEGRSLSSKTKNDTDLDNVKKYLKEDIDKFTRGLNNIQLK